jgi:hypothetical protein
MSLRKTLGRVLIFIVLELGALAGLTTPREIEKVLHSMHQTKIEYVVKKDDPG